MTEKKGGSGNGWFLCCHCKNNKLFLLLTNRASQTGEAENSAHKAMLAKMLASRLRQKTTFSAKQMFSCGGINNSWPQMK